jgi:hypothetical protein
LHATYDTFIDAFVFDALYANGPVMTQLEQHGYAGFLVLKKDKNERLKEALALWQEQGPCEQYQDPDKKEHLQFGTATTSRRSIATKFCLFLTIGIEASPRPDAPGC